MSVESTLPESSSVAYTNPQPAAGEYHRFAQLRGVRWRINLGILPSSSSNDDLRRVTADSRRRYAGLRRRLLVDPHLSKEGNNSPNVVIDNPLSQNPDSMWGRFFRNAELEKMVVQDLSRLYPGHGSYFQTAGCQGILRRVLILWCLRHPEYGYRQGMHELLAPLLYVLHVDVEHLSYVRTLYGDHFADKFDGLSFQENDHTYSFELTKFTDTMQDEVASHENAIKTGTLNDADPDIQTIILLSDAYGAEGELGIVLSEKFMEHDAYCMFDALMSGARGAVAMADFFSPSPAGGSHTGLPPVIEASSALYHLLSIVDISLHSHLVELGVEPQYFALRWLRVLFGREFSLEDLLIIWDEILASDNGEPKERLQDDAAFWILSSPRGAFISAMAVSMLLHMRSSLLATENATSCLQRLLNFPDNVDLQNLIGKAKSLLNIALDARIPSPFLSTIASYERSKSAMVRAHSLSSENSTSPKTPLTLVPESYWEEKWRVVHNAEELKQGSSGKQHSSRRKGWSEKLKLTLSRAESDPSPAKINSGRKNARSSVRRSLLEDLSRELGTEEDTEKLGDPEVSGQRSPLPIEGELEGQDSIEENRPCTVEEICVCGNAGSDESSSIFSPPTSPLGGANDNETEKSSVASNLSLEVNDYERDSTEPLHPKDDSPLPVSDPPENLLPQSVCQNDSTGKSIAALKDRKLLPGRFQWFWKFGRNGAAEGTSEKARAPENKTLTGGGVCSSTSNGISSSSLNSKGEGIDQNVMVTIRNLGHSMLENIQVIESAFQQDRGQLGSRENISKNALVGKGQVTAVAALKELRKISNILSEM